MVMPTSTPMLQAPASAAQRTTGLPSTASGRNGSCVATSRQANRPHRIAEASSSAPNSAEIQSNLRPPQDSASNSATAAAIIKQRADDVEPVLARMIGHALQDARRHAERRQAERQIDPEDQRPVEMLGQEAAEHRAADRRRREHRADIALVAAALAR